MTGILQSHVLSVEICAIFVALELALWIFSRQKKDVWQRILAGIKAVATAVLLNLSFLIPFFYFSQEDLMCFAQDNSVVETGVYFSQMFSLFINVDGQSLERGTTINEMSLTIGTALLIGAFVFAGWSVQLLQKEEKIKKTGWRCMLYAVLAILLASWLMPWGGVVERVPFMDKLVPPIQYLWRFLGPASFFLCVCTAIGLAKILEQKKEWNWAPGLVIGICLVTSWSLFDGMKDFPQYWTNPMHIASFYDLDSLYLYEGSKRSHYVRAEAFPYMLDGSAAFFSGYSREGTRLEMDVICEEGTDDYLVLPFYYYPGYQIKINGEKVDVYRRDTLAACRLPEGKSHVEVRYAGLPSFRVGDIVSLLSAAGICIYGLLVRKKRVGRVPGYPWKLREP